MKKPSTKQIGFAVRHFLSSFPAYALDSVTPGGTDDSFIVAVHGDRSAKPEDAIVGPIERNLKECYPLASFAVLVTLPAVIVA